MILYTVAFYIVDIVYTTARLSSELALVAVSGCLYQPMFTTIVSPDIERHTQSWTEPEFFFKKPKNRFQGINTASLCSLAGRYDNPIPTRFLVPIDS
jgi:hypothetical protein